MIICITLLLGLVAPKEAAAITGILLISLVGISLTFKILVDT